MKVYQQIAGFLAERGVGEAFVLMGDGNMDLIVALNDRGVRVVRGRHEQNVIAMADGYARAGRRVGVASVTHGPGLTQIGTPLVCARSAASPVLVLAGDTPTFDPDDIQNLDQSALINGLGVTSVRIEHPEAVAPLLSRTWRRLVTRGGPVVLSIPSDIQHAEAVADGHGADPLPIAPPTRVIVADHQAVHAAASLIVAALRPVVLAGRGAVDAAAGAEIASLAEHLGAPMVTSLRAAGFLGGHRLAVGVIGGIGTNLARGIVREADLVLALGATLNPATTTHGKLVEQARIIQVDTDPESLGRFANIHMGIVGDARLVAGGLLERLTELRPRGFPDRLATVTERICQWVRPQVPTGRSGAVDPRHALRALDEALSRDRVVVIDGGHFNVFAATEVSVPNERAMVWAAELGTVGQGLGTAVGAAIARPGDRVALVCGDGGFLMNPQELDTSVREGLPIVVFVMNDRGYGQEVHVLAAKGHPDDLARFSTPDLAAIARAFGASGHTVASPEDLPLLKEWLAGSRGPVVIDVLIDGSIENDTVANYRSHLRSRGMCA
ncbi:MAG: thiamine pyrophosphate-binding protein [Acidimicrobiales bacterium]